MSSDERGAPIARDEEGIEQVSSKGSELRPAPIASDEARPPITASSDDLPGTLSTSGNSVFEVLANFTSLPRGLPAGMRGTLEKTLRRERFHIGYQGSGLLARVRAYPERYILVEWNKLTRGEKRGWRWHRPFRFDGQALPKTSTGAGDRDEAGDERGAPIADEETYPEGTLLAYLPLYTPEHPRCAYTYQCEMHATAFAKDGTGYCRSHAATRRVGLSKPRADEARPPIGRDEVSSPVTGVDASSPGLSSEPLEQTRSEDAPLLPLHGSTPAYVDPTVRRLFHLPARYQSEYEASLADPDQVSLKRQIATAEARLAELQSRLNTGESGETWAALQWQVGGLRKLYNEVRFAASEEQRNVAFKAFHHGWESLVALVEEGSSDRTQWREVNEQTKFLQQLVETELRVMAQASHILTREQSVELLSGIVGIIRKHVKEPRVLRLIALDLQELAARIMRYFTLKTLTHGEGE